MISAFYEIFYQLYYWVTPVDLGKLALCLPLPAPSVYHVLADPWYVREFSGTVSVKINQIFRRYRTPPIGGDAVLHKCFEYIRP